MTIAELRKIALALPGATEDVKWEDHLCFNVGGKMFVITSPDTVPVGISFKASQADFAELTEREGILPAPYLARNHWVRVDDIKLLPQAEWERYLERAHQLVFSKLTKKLQREISGEA